MYLLDTCVISEIRHRKGNPLVRTRVSEMGPDRLYLSALTVGEIRRGAELYPDARKRQELLFWVNGLIASFASRILPVDAGVAQVWGQLAARDKRDGMNIPAVDQLIAATGICHGYAVVTRNTEHFVRLGATVIDPWLEPSP